jgi:hypothetical protein
VTRSAKLFTVAAFLVFSVCLLPLTDAVAGVVDQKQENITGMDQILSWEPIGQEFVPSLSPLIGVDVNIRPLNLSVADTVTLNIRQGTITSTILATVSQLVVAGFSGWIHYDLSTPLSVTVGSTYVLELTEPMSTFGWNFANSNPYPRGEAIVLGSRQLGMAFTFRTYAPLNVGAPVGGVVMPVNKLVVFAPYLALFGVLAVIVVVAAPWKKTHN